MRTTITRTITSTKIHGCKVKIENGTPVAEPVEPITVYGEVTEDQAQRKMDKAYGKNGKVVVSKIETEEKLYEISVEDFVKHATVVEENKKEEVK